MVHVRSMEMWTPTDVKLPSPYVKVKVVQPTPVDKVLYLPFNKMTHYIGI